MAKSLVVYYSRKGENHMPGGIQVLEKGNTEYAAEFIAEALHADIFEVDTVKPYAKDYRACCGEAFSEYKANARPEIKAYPASVSDYDNIFVCFPCWIGTAPMCIFTLLEHFDLTGKKIIPLCTNEGSGMGNAVAHLQRSCSGAEVTEGLAIPGHKAKDCQEAIALWAKSQI